MFGLRFKFLIGINEHTHIANSFKVSLLTTKHLSNRNEGIINYLITTPEPVFWTSQATGNIG